MSSQISNSIFKEREFKASLHGLKMEKPLDESIFDLDDETREILDKSAMATFEKLKNKGKNGNG